jgi:hypothetical protein
MHQTEAFLRLILPREGWYCSVIFDALGRVHHNWFKSIELLAENLLHCDRQGLTVYHACAAYVQPSRRTKANVRAIKSLWLDLDGDQRQSVQSLIPFCRLEHLPLPVSVNSGYGLHVYWPLERELSRQEWEGYARGLRERARQRHLHFDAARTCDAASILRPIASHNRKHETPREVELLLAGEAAVSLSTLARQESQAKVAPNKLAWITEIPQYLRAIPILPETRLEDDPADASAIAEHCEQMRNMRDKRGALKEPLWHAAIGVLAFCHDGNRFTHLWSQGDDRYDYHQTQGYYDRATANRGPTTCEHFNGLDSTICARCPHYGKITTPLQLGRGRWSLDDGGLPGAGGYSATEHHRDDDRGAATEAAGAGQAAQSGLFSETAGAGPRVGHRAYPMSEGFVRGPKDELCVTGKWDPKTGETGPAKVVCPYPLYMTNVLKNSDGELLEFSLYRDYRDTPIVFTVPNRESRSPNLVAYFDNWGCNIREPSELARWVQNSRELWLPQEQIDSNGWHRHRFALETDMYDAGEAYPANMIEEAKASQTYLRKGTYKAWLDGIHTMFDNGPWIQEFGLLCGFAAPLMKFTNAQVGGVVISFYSPETGTGKSMALKAGASIWGSFKKQNMKNLDTPLSRFHTLNYARHLPVFWDDMSIDTNRNKERDEVRRFLGEFQEGQERKRLSSAGQALKPVLGTWNTLLLVSTNHSLYNALRGHAMGARVIELRAPDKKLKIPETMGVNFVENCLEENCGDAGHLFIQALTKATPEELNALLINAQQQLRKDYTQFIGEKHRFWLNALSACVVAAEIINKTGIFKRDFRECLMRVCRELLASEQAEAIRDQFDAPKLQKASFSDFVRYIMQFTVGVPGPYKGKPIQLDRSVPVPRVVHARHERDTNTLYFSKKEFQKWCNSEGINIHDLDQEMKRRKIFVGKPTVNLTEGTGLPGVRTECVKADLTKADELPDSPEDLQPPSSPLPNGPTA